MNDSQTITATQAITWPRFEFIAHALVVLTRKKAERALSGGKRVKRTRGGIWQILYPNELVEYQTSDAGKLYDFARRGSLNYFVRYADDFRAAAYEEAARKARSTQISTQK